MRLLARPADASPSASASINTPRSTFFGGSRLAPAAAGRRGAGRCKSLVPKTALAMATHAASAAWAVLLSHVISVGGRELGLPEDKLRGGSTEPDAQARGCEWPADALALTCGGPIGSGTMCRRRRPSRMSRVQAGRHRRIRPASGRDWACFRRELLSGAEFLRAGVRSAMGEIRPMTRFRRGKSGILARLSGHCAGVDCGVSQPCAAPGDGHGRACGRSADILRFRRACRATSRGSAGFLRVSGPPWS